MPSRPIHQVVEGLAAVRQKRELDRGQVQLVGELGLGLSELPRNTGQ